MTELVHERLLPLLVDAEGRIYNRAFVYAEMQSGGTWRGSIEFVSDDGEKVLGTGQETTQSTVEDVAYWATGLELVYFEGAFRRALNRADPDRAGAPLIPATGRPSGGPVPFTIESLDPEVPLLVMASRTLVPGLRRAIHNGGVLVYRGTSTSRRADRPDAYEFVAQFATENAAALLANTLWTELHGRVAVLVIDGVEVPIQNAAIKEALTAAVGV